MTNFITNDTALDPTAIRSRGFAARVFPEFPSEEEITLVANRLAADEIEFWAYEFGQPARNFAPQPVGLMLDALFENSPYNLLIHFCGHDLFVWAPEDHEYFVVFGDPIRVGAVARREIFPYGFPDYLTDENLSQPTVKHLREVAATYTFGSLT